MHDRSVQATARRRQTQRGFTLIELLIVVAIVVVLAAVAIPMINQSKNDLESAELDAVARQIFIAAQNKSTAMVALGTFDDFDAGREAAILPDGLNENGEYHYAGHTYLAKSYLEILPAGAISSNVLTDQYYIEYNAKTGDIYGVFYGKNGFDYAEAVLLRAESHRKTKGGVGIGYFGGAVGAGMEAVRTQTPDFTLVNGEELYVRFARIDEGTVYTLTVADATSPQTEPLYFRIDTNDLIGSRIGSEPNVSGAVVKLPFKEDVDGSLCILLDSLDDSADPNFSSRRFKDNFTDGNGNALLTPGHDLYVSGKAQKAADEEKKILYLESDSVSYFTNSLFDSALREKEQNESVGVHNFRHLQNLDAASGYKPTTALFEARLTARLDWKDADARKATVGYTAPDTLTAISNDALLVFDGQGNAIENAPLSANQNGASTDGTAGLFGVFTGRKDSAIKRVRLVDPVLAPAQNAAVTHAGLLAGRVDGNHASITDCRVFATASGGAANAECAAILPKSVLYAGGLIGAMQGGTVTDCFAAMPVIRLLDDAPTESRYLGGLIGAAKAVALERCYANTGLLNCVMGGEKDKLGGLIGLADGGKCGACYASGVLDLDGARESCQLSGFANVQNNPAFTSCYTVVTYGESLYAPAFINPANNGTRVNNGAKVYAFADAPKGASADGRFYLRTDGVTEFCTDDGQTYGEGLSYDAMKSESLRARFSDARWANADAAHTHAYTAAATGLYPFPIPTGTATSAVTPYPIDHYGDWPARQGEKYLAYYEKYKNGQYGFFAGNGVEIDTLQDSADAAVVEDGYAVLCEQTDPAPTLAYVTSAGLRTAALTNSGQLVGATLTADAQAHTYRAWCFPAEALRASVAQKQPATAKDSYFHVFAAGGYRLFANPNFAKYVVNGQDALPGVSYEPTRIVLRTSRQLHRLSLPAQNVYWDRAFSQERRIDFVTYPAQVTDQPMPQPIGNSAVPFTGIFDGNRNVINGLNVVVDAASADEACAGMFGNCQGMARLTRIRLQNPSVSGGTAYAGILAGRLRAQAPREGSQNFMVSDCYVYAKASVENAFLGDPGFNGACTLTTSAGIVGGLAGSIESSSVCDTLVSPTKIEMRDGTHGGGFAGKLDGAGTVIEQCYANTKLLKTDIVGMLGGFAGESTATVRGAYALGAISAKESEPAGFIHTNNGSCTMCYTLCTYNQTETEDLYLTHGYGFSKVATASKLQNCYYWGTRGLIESDFGETSTYGELKALRENLALTTYGRFSRYAGETHRYEQSGSYPFAFLILSDNNVLTTNVMPHYGDWPSAGGTYLAYYEQYREADGKSSYGFYTTVFNQLDDANGRENQKEIIDDGYAILSTEPIKHVTYGRRIDGASGDDAYHTLSLITDIGAHFTWEHNSVAYQVYCLKEDDDPENIIGMGRSTQLAERLTDESTPEKLLRYSFYYRVNIDGDVFYFNPCFAKAIASTLTLEPAGAVAVRSPRQFLNLVNGRSDRKYWGWSNSRADRQENTLTISASAIRFMQEHDIDFGGSETIKPIGNDQQYFRNHYNGDAYTLKNLSIANSTQYTGLFGYNTGELKNILFLSENAHTITSSSDNVGGLVGCNGKGRNGDNGTGSIDGCIVAGFDILTNGRTGGFAAVNEGAITNCGAVLYTPPGGSAGGGIRGGESGGFVCSNSGSIDHCFAISTNSYQNKDAQSGFVKMGGGSVQNAYCAAYYDVSDPARQGYLASGASGCLAYDGTSESYEAIKNTYGSTADAAHTHSFDSALSGASPWPSFVSDYQGYPIFYGNWMIP